MIHIQHGEHTQTLFPSTKNLIWRDRQDPPLQGPLKGSLLSIIPRAKRFFEFLWAISLCCQCLQGPWRGGSCLSRHIRFLGIDSRCLQGPWRGGPTRHWQQREIAHKSSMQRFGNGEQLLWENDTLEKLVLRCINGIRLHTQYAYICIQIMLWGGYDS